MQLPFATSDFRNVSFKPAFILVLSAFCLVCIHFLSGRLGFDLVAAQISQLVEERHRDFWKMIFWASTTIFFYVAIPIFVIRLVFKEKISEYGLKWKGAFSFAGFYALAFLLLFPFVVWVSFSPEFQVTYPFFVPTNRNEMIPYFLVWEIFYVAQFFALEFFFRGWMVLGLKKDLGLYSVFVMVIPYCMIHFTKPMPECVGSIFAGVFLGLMTYRTQSVWMGALLHVAVALSMDFLSLWHKGYF
ncbi:MAG: CPBP family intramembrane metalloprotease [Bacteroidetes bacterium]|nr:CPBP family intramembrane metalloprotease [Bacteroidota bacterium]